MAVEILNPVEALGPRGWSMRHGHRHALAECSGHKSFAKTVTRKHKHGTKEEADHIVSSQRGKIQKIKGNNGKLLHKDLMLDWYEEAIQAPAEIDWPLDPLTCMSATCDYEEQTTLQPSIFTIAPQSYAEEAEFLRRAIRESEEEANLQEAIQKSLQQCNVKRDASHESAEPEILGFLLQTSAPCIASELANAEDRIAYLHVPLTACRLQSASSTSQKPSSVKGSLWLQAVEQAALVAKEYDITHRERTKPTTKLNIVAKKVHNPVKAEEQSTTYSTVPIQGYPPAPQEHHRVLQLAVQNSNGYPACWGDKFNRQSRRTYQTHQVPPSSVEYDAVIGYFNATVGFSGIDVQELIRLQNPTVYSHFHSGYQNTIMFHGCRSPVNENSIIENGFQVSHCKSGGPQFGTWFAYGAAYSNSGYAFMDQHGVRHLFVCVVSSRRVVLDNSTMRVVGQGCAYPLWLLKYKENRQALSKPVSRKTHSGPRDFYVVKNGTWVLE